MKRVFTLLSILLLYSATTNGQRAFAPVGAEWYNEMQFGIFHSVAVSDTVIQGHTCRKIVQRAGRNPFHTFMGPFVYDLPTRYMHNNGTGDTIFLYNDFFHRFTPVYVFNVQAGDTVCLPVFPPQNGKLINISDSSYCFVVDSVKTVLYDTALLETVYARPFDTPGHAKFSYGEAYIRVIGAHSGALLPNCGTCAFLMSDLYQAAGDLRCYHDEHTSVKLVNDTCSKGIKVSVEELTGEGTLKVFPNPARDKLMLHGLNNNAKLQIYISDMQGRVVSSLTQKVTDSYSIVDISTFTPGVFLLQLIENGIFKGYARVVIAK